jgi:hypothetical protein
MNQKQRDFGDNRFLACVKDPEFCKKRISRQMTVRRNFYQMNIIIGIVFILSLIGSELGHKSISPTLLLMILILGFSLIRFYVADFEVKALKSIYITHLKDTSDTAEQGAAADP